MPADAPAPAALLRGVDRAAFAVSLSVRLRQHGVPVGLTGTEDFTRAYTAFVSKSRPRFEGN